MKKLLSPFMRLMFLVIVVIGFALLIVEQIILYILIPFAWILFGKRPNELCKISFIIWLANNKVLPFFEKVGVINAF